MANQTAQLVPTNVGRLLSISSSSFIRADNTDAYTANTLVTGGAGEYINWISQVKQGGGIIKKVKLSTDDSGATGDFLIHFFQCESIATYTDGSALALTYEEARDFYLGSIPLDITTPIGGQTCAYALSDIPYKKGADGYVIAVLQTVDGFTPDAESQWSVEISLENNYDNNNLI